MSTDNQKIKIGFLISYDYYFLKEALPSVYKHADSITLAVDKDGKTWNGGSVDIPDSFFDWIKEYDTENKISIYKDSFYIPELSPIECDTRERNMLAQFMGEGGWHFQIDADEYFLDFGEFVNYVKSLDYSKKTLVFAQWITLYKQDENGYYLAEPPQYFQVVTNDPHYTYARDTDESYIRIYSDHLALHQTWARSEEEMEYKIKNWGHSLDFDANSYFNLWKAINKSTYKYIHSFHILDPWIWKYLSYYEAKDIPSLIEKVRKKEIQKSRRRKMPIK